MLKLRKIIGREITISHILLFLIVLAIDPFVSDILAAELICTDLWFYIGKVSGEEQRDKEHTGAGEEG